MPNILQPRVPSGERGHLAFQDESGATADFIAMILLSQICGDEQETRDQYYEGMDKRFEHQDKRLDNFHQEMKSDIDG